MPVALRIKRCGPWTAFHFSFLCSTVQGEYKKLDHLPTTLPDRHSFYTRTLHKGSARLKTLPRIRHQITTRDRIWPWLRAAFPSMTAHTRRPDVTDSGHMTRRGPLPRGKGKGFGDRVSEDAFWRPPMTAN